MKGQRNIPAVSRTFQSTALAAVLWGVAGGAARSDPALPPAAPPATAPAPPDSAGLDRLFADGLFDPTGRQFVSFRLPERDAWGGKDEREVSGWRVEPKPGGAELPWAVLLTGEAAPVTGPAAPADFVGQCRSLMDGAEARASAGADRAKRRGAATHPSTTPGEDAGNGADELDDITARLYPRPAGPEPAAFLAAWLHRLGRDDEAARMLRLTGAVAGDKDAAAVPRPMNPWHWYSRAVHAWMARADAESLFYVGRLAAYFPDAMKEPPAEQGGAGGRGGPEKAYYPQAAALRTELERRRKEGTFGKGHDVLPADFGAWPVERRVAELVRQLEDVDARQQGQPGGVDLASDPRVAVLIDLGDPAVAALIDCVEGDSRLTRSVHFWRDFAASRTVLGVREAALTAVMSILRTRVFEPAATGDNFTSRGAGQAEETARVLRAYWKTYGGLGFDERMMTILRDGKAKPEAWREAAGNLANFGEKRTLGTTVWAGGGGGRAPGSFNPVIGKFKGPTVAEAILAAMDRDLARHDQGAHDELYDYRRRGIESEYLGALAELGDGSIVPALLKRLEDPPGLRTRRLLSAVCFSLGEARPLAGLAEDVLAGRVTLPAGLPPGTNVSDRPDVEELKGIMQTLSDASVRLPVADAALFALADPRHPMHALAAENVRRGGRSYEDRSWVSHPYALGILRADLDDVTPTGGHYAVEGSGARGRLSETFPNGSSSGPVPAALDDEASRLDHVDVRRCDEAAERISGMILGAPFYHPLLKDAPKRLEDLKALLDAHLPHLRRATYAEAGELGGSPFDTTFILNVRRLVDGATAKDVAEGRAIFHLDGGGTPLDLKLPATGVLRHDLPPEGRPPTAADVDAGRARRGWKRDREAEHGMREEIEWSVPRVLVLQAERSPDGKRRYGIVSRYGMREVSEDELGDVKPLGEP